MQRQQYWDWVDDVRNGSDGSDESKEHVANEDGATWLYQQYAPSIFAYLRIHTASREDAEDLLVEVFLAALENRYFQLLPEPAQRAWLWRVARNKTIDGFRKRRSQKHHIPLDDLAEALYLDEHFSPEQTTLRQEEYAQLRIAISKLPEAQQQVLWLRFVSGLRCTEIAKVLGRREGTVRSLLSRALNLLRNVYE